MEASLQSNKPITTHDAVLGLVSITPNQEDAEQFNMVIDEASQKLDQDRQRTEEEEDEKRARKRRIEAEGVESDLVGLGASVEDLIQAEKKIELSEKAKKLKQLARQKTVAQEHKELSKANQDTVNKLRKQNGTGKALQSQTSNVPRTSGKLGPSEGQGKDGIQVASMQDNTVMADQQNISKSGVRSTLVEELRPATSAVETIARSGNQQAQQDLPRETLKDQSLPVTPIQTNAPATSSVASAHAMASMERTLSPMLEKIWDAVTTFRVRGENEMVVKVQPDNDTEMQLTIKYGAEGVEIGARMQQGDGRQLASGWNELQQQLFDRGVRLGELLSSDPEDDVLNSDSRQSGWQNQSHYKPEDIQLGDEQADWSALGLPAREQETTKQIKQSTDKVEEAYDGWQSWA